jgi:hypothetical protein
MPFIVSISQVQDNPTRHGRARTIDEARDDAYMATISVPGYTTVAGFPTYEWVRQMIGEQGGVIGPLPDGSVIDVWPV